MSVQDVREFPDGHRIEADVCIVGGGPAAITVALELADAGLRIAILEGGGREFDDRVQRLYEGEVTGETYRDLDVSRLRMLGGSTNHWEGYCRPLDPDDVDREDDRDWSVTYEEIAAHYERAQELCELPRFDYRAEQWATELGRPLLDPTDAPLVSEVIHRSPPTRFGERYEDELVESGSVDVYLFANVVELVAEDQRVSSVTIADFDGSVRSAVADRFVLATGGIENARLLLASDQGRPGGIGNQHDLVGRFFAEHPHMNVGHVIVPDDLDLSFYLQEHQVEGGAAVRGLFTIPYQERRMRGSSNVTALLHPERGTMADGTDVDAARMLARAFGDGGEGQVRLQLIAEQVTVPQNRVELSGARDELGMRRARLDWRLQDQDWQTLSGAMETLAAALPLAGIGPVHSPMHHGRGRISLSWGNHHLGTTRMHDDPTRGVVDRDGRVHGIDNLYVAGSSVFPTAGWANPTLTLVALAIRLGAHLREGTT